MRLTIHDEVDTPQRFELGRLFETVTSASGYQGSWRVLRADGYGLRVNELDRRSDAEAVFLSASALRSLVGAPDEWFYNLEARSEAGDLVFGLLDSSYMFFEGPAVIADDIAKQFKNVRQHIA